MHVVVSPFQFPDGSQVLSRGPDIVYPEEHEKVALVFNQIPSIHFRRTVSYIDIWRCYSWTPFYRNFDTDIFLYFILWIRPKVIYVAVK